jgi:hypothetical protein
MILRQGMELIRKLAEEFFVGWDGAGLASIDARLHG